MQIQKSYQPSANSIPNEWKYEDIEKCCNILDSKRVPLNSEERKKILGNIPYYGANGVQGYINRYIFDQDLVLLAEDGGYFNEYKNRPIAYYVTGKCWVNNHAHVLTAKENYNLKWIFYSLVHKNILPWIKGSTRTKLNQSELRKITIPIPTIFEQQEIASILSKVDGLIQKTDQIIEQTRRLKKALMQMLLTKGIGYCKFKKSVIGIIPEEWSVIDLEHIIKDIRYGTSVKCTSNPQGIPILRIPNIVHGVVSFEDLKYAELSPEDLERFTLRDGDIIFVRTNGNREYVGRCAVFHKINKDYGFASYLIRARLSLGKIDPEFFTLQSSLPKIKNQILNHSKTSAGQYNINTEGLKSLKVIIPPLNMQRSIVSIISNIQNITNVYRNQKIKIGKLKKGLMQNLLTGKIRVTV